MTKRLISAADAIDWVSEAGCRVFDCRFDLQHRHRGRDSWLASHIPGAAYADLDKNLAGRITAGSGRHPLPNASHFASFLARSGWEPGMSILAYDAQGGAFAARLWWLMRYFGHDCVTLLDGGFNAWRIAGGPLESGEVVHDKHPLVKLHADTGMTVNASEVAKGLQEKQLVLVDARDAGRFAGQNESIDPVAGHVPGAINIPFQENLNDDGLFQPASELAGRFQSAIQHQGASEVVHMCGSGVTACHNLFAMEHSGLGGSRLYVGSWSEWIRDPDRPIAASA